METKHFRPVNKWFFRKHLVFEESFKPGGLKKMKTRIN